MSLLVLIGSHVLCGVSAISKLAWACGGSERAQLLDGLAVAS